MNLLHDPWMPVRDAQGQRHWITPNQLADPRWLAFDADRPDFNGALAQFAIGLLQTTTPVADVIAWRGLMRAPPSAQTLKLWFAPVAEAFQFDGEGARFMQDFSLATEPGKPSPIAEILIDAPGENSLDGNKDLFVKRGVVDVMCLDCASTALLALQINAPEGGRGHFTGLRGGGPLTTLVVESGGSNLWRSLWMNVIESEVKRFTGAERPLRGAQALFPWLGSVEQLQRPGSSTTAVQVDGCHVFWAMPRRIRFEFSSHKSDVACSICARKTNTAAFGFRSRPNGFNYPSNAWRHPLTPYRQKDDAWLPIRPKGDGLGYRHWLAWVLAMGAGSIQRARVVDHALVQRSRQLASGLRLWSFGYEMRKDKAVQWHEGLLPLYNLGDCETTEVRLIESEVGRWLAAAEMASVHLRNSVKDAWFGGTARGDYAHVDASFWSSTEAPFYRHLQVLIEAASNGTEHPALATRQAWHATLVRAVLRLFDEAFVGAGVIERQNPRRTALAHKQLVRNLHGPKLKQALGLPVDEPTTKPARKTPKRTAKEAA
jgi:CRISPR system Cascade subunit CasA